MVENTNSTSFQNLLPRAWSGGLPLWQIFWLGLVLISFALAGVLRFVVLDVLFALSVKNSLLVFFLLALPVLAFIWVAVWRSAAHSKFFARNAARTMVIVHAIWFGFKFARYLAIYGTLA